MRTTTSFTRSLISLSLLGLIGALGGCSLITDSKVNPSGLTATCTSDDDCHASTCNIRAGDSKGICVSQCSASADCPEGTMCAKGLCQAPLKVGGIWVGVTAFREGWTLTHQEGVEAAQASLGYVDFRAAEGMFGDEAILPEVEKMVTKEGRNVIIFNSFDHRAQAEPLAAKYPNVKFLVCSGRPKSPNLGAFFAHLEQSWFVAGKIAAGLTKTKRLGFIGSYITPEVVRHLNAWIRGAQSEDPNIKIEVRWTGFWYDYNTSKTFKYTPKFLGEGAVEENLYAEEYATALLIDGGADIIGHQSDNQRPGVYVESKYGKIVDDKGAARKVWVIANDNQYGWRNQQSETKEAYKTSIGAVYWNWTPLYSKIFEDIHRDQWKVYDINEAMAEDKSKSLISFEVNTESEAGLDDSAIKNLLTQQAKAPYTDVFKGPYETTGQRDAIAAGETLSDKELRQMCWFSKGIVEKSVPLDTSSPDQDAMVPTSTHPAPADAAPTTPPYVLLPVAPGVPRGVAWNCDENQIPE